ncbi:MAG TPA: hypothetical protein VFM37_14065 [Pseudonocardiaceae bacterium]|nr:hypothetical protein [Pseudonocardiaceae bacterium]
MLPWQLLTAGPLAVVGLLTVRAGVLATRGRLAGDPADPPASDDPAESPASAAARVAGPPITAAGVVAVVGALVAVLQPTLPAMLTVAAIAWAGALGLAVAARRLATRAVSMQVAGVAVSMPVAGVAVSTPVAGVDDRAAGGAPRGACAGCPLTGSDRTACCGS